MIFCTKCTIFYIKYIQKIQLFYTKNTTFRRTNMVVFTLEQRWEVGLRSTYRKCRF